MDHSLQAHMLAERCQMYLRHLRGIVYLLNYQSQLIRPGQLPGEWKGLMQQIQHLAETTEREIKHFQQAMIKEIPSEKSENSKAA